MGREGKGEFSSPSFLLSSSKILHLDNRVGFHILCNLPCFIVRKSPVKLHPESALLFHRDESVEKAKNIAMRLLSGRAYTRREIQDRLMRRGCADGAIEETLDTLVRLGLVDDRAFAHRFVEERLRLKPSGRMVLSRDLKRRGVPEAVIAEVLDEALSEVDVEEVATEVLRQRSGRYRGLSRDKALARMCGFLGRRGFDASVARQAARVVWAEIDSENGRDLA